MKLAKAAGQNVTLIQPPRAGVALYEEHIKLLRFLENEGEADLLPTTVDSYTRLNRYNEAETGIEKSKETGRSMLNGFPIVNYGVDICRKVTSSLKIRFRSATVLPMPGCLLKSVLPAGLPRSKVVEFPTTYPILKIIRLKKNHCVLAIYRQACRAL